jgi:hemerythrin superfamily protein
MARIRSQRNMPAMQRRSPRPLEAIALLKADHRQVKSWFGQFAKARGDDRKLELATSLCAALRVHMLIEEEIFYPSFLEATSETRAHHEAAVEHDAARRLIDEIEASGPMDEFFDAKVNVLGEMIRHHVAEEERPGGMFARARRSTMNLRLLGERMRERKQQIEGQISAMPSPVSRAKNGILSRILDVASR